LRTATTAAATIKVCAISVAAVGLLASVGIVLRGVMGTCQAWAWHRSQGMSLRQMLRLLKLFQWRGVSARDESRPKPWWEEVLAPEDLPVPAATDEAVKVKVSGETAEALTGNQQSWVRANNVPGIIVALKDRTKPLQALCLSGGGVRSACVAMGAMQVFSEPSSASEPNSVFYRLFVARPVGRFTVQRPVCQLTAATAVDESAAAFIDLGLKQPAVDHPLPGRDTTRQKLGV
jgi:hypothetical protein